MRYFNWPDIDLPESFVNCTYKTPCRFRVRRKPSKKIDENL